METHIHNQADITAVYQHGIIPQHMSEPTVYSVKENGALRDMLIHPKVDGPCNYGLNMYVINRPLLIELIEDLRQQKTCIILTVILFSAICFNIVFIVIEFKGYSKVILFHTGLFPSQYGFIKS